VNSNEQKLRAKLTRRTGPFRRAVLRGLGTLLPPLLTIVILLWVGNSVARYFLEPLERSIRWVMVDHLADIRTPSEIITRPDGQDIAVIDGHQHKLTSRRATVTVVIGDEVFQRTPSDGKFIPLGVYETVRQRTGGGSMPTDAKAIYTTYVNDKWLQPLFVMPIFACVFLLVLYLVGKFLAAGFGRFFWKQLERIIHHVPLVRTVYDSVKQVTDFLFTDTDMEYTRVVAIEYPRDGMWTLCFVTGEGMWDLRGVSSEPLLTVFIPTSPLPFQGFPLTVKKSDVIDLNISIDQAIQFIVSCGVAIPPPIIGVPQRVAPNLEQSSLPPPLKKNA
jgi:uncharacterized membrane protein